MVASCGWTAIVVCGTSSPISATHIYNHAARAHIQTCCMHAQSRTYARTCIRTRTCACSPTCTHTRTYAHAHALTLNTHAHCHTHSRTCSHSALFMHCMAQCVRMCTHTFALQSLPSWQSRLVTSSRAMPAEPSALQTHFSGQSLSRWCSSWHSAAQPFHRRHCRRSLMLRRRNCRTHRASRLVAS